MNNPFSQAGFEQAGQQTGSGGPFHVARALSVGGQVVRVVFSTAPKTRSSASFDDALNASNYQLAIVSGQGQIPQSVGVHSEPIAFPAYGVFNAGEVAIDLQSDRPLIAGMGYSVLVSDAIKAADGSTIGSPYSWNFVGVARPVVTLPQRGKLGLVDLASDPISGGIIVDSSGDWAPDNGDSIGTRKRCIRRVMTTESAFVHLYGYGLYFDIKLPMTSNKLGKLRTGVQTQLAQEPDVTSVATQVSADALGFLSIGMRVKTKAGQNVPTVLSVSPSGVTVE